MADDSILNDDISQLSNSSKQKGISLKYKIIVGCVFTFGFLLYRLVYKKYLGETCNIDKYHQLTYEANRKLYHGWDNTIIGIGQLLMDGWVMFMGFYWLWKIKNMRFPIAAGVFFLFRALLLNTSKFPFPQDIVWHNPGFLSITVPYDHTRDFYYSGHTGTLTIISLELWTLERKTMCAVCLVSLLYMVNMLTITRIHYSIDIIGALIFAPFWYFAFTQRFLDKIDFGFSTPYYLFRKIYKGCKKSSYAMQGSEIDLESNSTAMKNKQAVKDQKEMVEVKLDMNDEITNSHDFPYMHQSSEPKK